MNQEQKLSTTAKATLINNNDLALNRLAELLVSEPELVHHVTKNDQHDNYNQDLDYHDFESLTRAVKLLTLEQQADLISELMSNERIDLPDGVKIDYRQTKFILRYRNFRSMIFDNTLGYLPAMTVSFNLFGAHDWHLKTILAYLNQHLPSDIWHCWTLNEYAISKEAPTTMVWFLDSTRLEVDLATARKFEIGQQGAK